MDLGKTRRTVAVDLRGHGASDAPPQEYTVASFADDLLWQCRELGLVKPIVVGHGMGGTIALELAARHPGLLSAVVLIDSVLIPPPPMLDVLRSLADAIRGVGYRSAMEQALSMLFLPSDDADLRTKIAASMAATPQRVLASAFTLYCVRDTTNDDKHRQCDQMGGHISLNNLKINRVSYDICGQSVSLEDVRNIAPLLPGSRRWINRSFSVRR